VTLAEAVLLTLSAPTAGATAYLALLTALSRRPPAPRASAPHLRFDLVVPAHDEAEGIARTVESLLAIDYPRALRRVLVVADNCSDDTAARARAAGAEVLTRCDTARRGKGYALAHAFARILADERADAVVVIDADTVVSPNLLHAFAARIERGAAAVQADDVVDNPEGSWRTLLMAVAMSAVCTLRSLGRERLSLSAGLHGTGMCFTVALLRAVPYEAFSVVEDLEHGIRLAEAGHRVQHAHEARVLARMPTGERASTTQRQRWEAGRQRLAETHARRLLVQALRRRDPVLLDLALELLVPPLGTLLARVIVGLAASMALSLHLARVIPATWAWLASALGLLAYGLRAWQLSGTGARGLAGLAAVPRYLLWKVLLRGRRGVTGDEWVRTARGADESR
jgi:GT2 family glycosyltransferase